MGNPPLDKSKPWDWEGQTEAYLDSFRRGATAVLAAHKARVSAALEADKVDDALRLLRVLQVKAIRAEKTGGLALDAEDTADLLAAAELFYGAFRKAAEEPKP